MCQLAALHRRIYCHFHLELHQATDEKSEAEAAMKSFKHCCHVKQDGILSAALLRGETTAITIALQGIPAAHLAQPTPPRRIALCPGNGLELEGCRSQPEQGGQDAGVGKLP